MSRIYENGRINWNAMRESQGVSQRLFEYGQGAGETLDGGEISTSKRTSDLPPKVRGFLKLIANTKNMVEAVVSLNFDISSSFDEDNIEDGYKFLREIEKEIEKNNTKGETFKDAQKKYYDVIPHKLENTIDTLKKVKDERKLLELLDDICRGAQVIDEAQRSTEWDKEIVEVYYDSLHCSITRLAKNRTIYKDIEQYLNATLEDHVNIKNVFEVERDSESNRFRNEANRWLLWHGSRIANFSSILSQGLRIAPPNVPSAGYMFGKGIYFADMAIKSYRYCKPKIGKKALLLLCEVALGEWEELYESKDVPPLKTGCSSVKGIGLEHPYHKSNKKIEGFTIPLGSPVNTNDSELKTIEEPLKRNEYIVYDVEQVKLRYVVEVTVKKLLECGAK